jgi:predicted O-linked N-acetylglucosamine transferase (SPINDLY family)
LPAAPRRKSIWPASNWPDLFLDTLPYNAHTTASDALWMGLPLITTPGNSFPARVAASILKAANVPELIAADLKEYEMLALKLARDPALLAGIRQKLVSGRTAWRCSTRSASPAI